ncbi:hypothetical protein QQF64_032064, partial [Cirrhinus molitorella]
MMMASGDLAGAMLGRVMSDIDSHGGALLPYSSSTVTVTTSPLGPSQLRLTPPVQTSRGVFPASQSQSSHHSAPPVGNNEKGGKEPNRRHVATVIRYSLPPSGLGQAGCHGDWIVTDKVTSPQR